MRQVELGNQNASKKRKPLGILAILKESYSIHQHATRWHLNCLACRIRLSVLLSRCHYEYFTYAVRLAYGGIRSGSKNFAVVMISHTPSAVTIIHRTTHWNLPCYRSGYANQAYLIPDLQRSSAHSLNAREEIRRPRWFLGGSVSWIAK